MCTKKLAGVRIRVCLNALIEIKKIQWYEADALFVMIGADANTSWLPDDLERDPRGYICTGRELTAWKLARHPFPLETSLPGVFCAGDVRHNSIKRVSSGRRQHGHRFHPSVPCFAGKVVRDPTRAR
jgi:thioredoxin reductase